MKRMWQLLLTLCSWLLWIGSSFRLPGFHRSIGLSTSFRSIAARNGFILQAARANTIDTQSSDNNSYSYPDHKVLSNFFLFSGAVQKGYGRGSRKVGFPTANLPQFEAQLNKTSLENGVYYGLAQVEADTAVHYCVANIGYSPTFTGAENRQRIIETHLLDYDSTKPDFYDRNLKVVFIGFLRKEMKFPSVEKLQATIEQDIMITRELFECLHDQGLLLSLQKQFFPEAIGIGSKGPQHLDVTDVMLP